MYIWLIISLLIYIITFFPAYMTTDQTHFVADFECGVINGFAFLSFIASGIIIIASYFIS